MSRDYLSSMIEDIDVDLSDNEINDILNEKEIETEIEIDDINILKEDKEIFNEDLLKSFITPKRISLKYSTDSARDIEEDRQRLDMFLQLDKPSNKIFEKVDPLDLIHKKELQDAISTDNILKTSLKDKRQYQETKLPVIQFEELKLISLKIAPPSNINSPLPSALAVSQSLIIIGNRNGQILVFNYSGHEILSLKPKKGFGQVTSIDITDDENAAVVGYHFGQVAL